jgi:molybdopterin-guanine dinucleotide biosynthesis protein A
VVKGILIVSNLKTSTFHPLEIAISGFSNSGKTTLLEKILCDLKFRGHRVGIIKHDGHHFEMDSPGKDTFRYRQAGASNVLINTQNKFCLQGEYTLNQHSLKQMLIDDDFVLVEGHKDSSIPKLVMVDSEKKILDYIEQKQTKNILGYIVPKSSDIPLLEQKSGKPVFFRDDISTISTFISKTFACMTAPKIKGLILAGGKSTRMGSDKGALKYFNNYQSHHLYEKLKNHLDEVFVSVRPEQVNDDHLKDLPKIIDLFPSAGPMAGILSAQQQDPDAAWLVVAIDLPYLDDTTIKKLIHERDPYKVGTCYKNPIKGWPEPLCTIWEPKSKVKLHQFWGMDRLCPRKVLFNSEIKLMELDNLQALDNCNTPQDFIQAKTYFSQGEVHANN